MTYRLRPTVGQTGRLEYLLASQRHLYNAALEERRGAWRWERRSVTWVDQFKQLTGPEARLAIPSLEVFGLAPHRGTLKRLDEAFAGFFRRLKVRSKAGFPRFRSKARFDSVTYPEPKGWVLTSSGTTGTYGRLRLMGVGQIKIRLAHGKRARLGIPAKLVVRRSGCGRRAHWDATVFYKHCEKRLSPFPTAEAAGVDRGVAVLAAVVDTAGTSRLVANPAHLRRAQEHLRRKQQVLARRKSGGVRRRWAAAELARAHRRVARARRDGLHQLSRRLVDDYSSIVIEDLKIANMVRSAKGTLETPGRNVAAKAGLNRSVLDAGWGMLAAMIAYKAEEAGRRLITVDPRRTSQRCSICAHVDPASRHDQRFSCTSCGHQDHADLNAAANLLITAGYTTPWPGSGPAPAAKHAGQRKAPSTLAVL